MGRTGFPRGVVAYPVTPTKNSGAEVDEARLGSLITTLVESGVHGITVVGSTGAFGSFTESERERIAEVAIATVAGRVPVFVGTGATTTDEAIRLSRHAEAAGAAGLQVVAMAHWPLTGDELYEYYREIAAAVSIPVVLHNVPSLSNMDMSPALIARLVETTGIRLIKEGSGELSRVMRLRRRGLADIEFWHDNDVTAFQGMLGGAAVWTPVVSALLPRSCVELYDLLVRRNDLHGALALFDRMLPLIEFISDKGAVRALHAAFDLLDEPVGKPRRPLLPLTPADRDTLRALMLDFGFPLGAGAEVVSDLWVKVGTTDLTSYVATLQQTQPDLIFSSLLFADMPIFMKQASAAGLASRAQFVFPAAGFQHVELKKEFTPAGMILGHNTMYFEQPNASALLKEFVSDYHGKYATYPHFEADRAYFTMAAYKAGVEKALAANSGKWPTKEQIGDALRGIEVESLGGRVRYRDDGIPECNFFTGFTTHSNSYDFCTVDRIETMHTDELQKPKGADFLQWINSMQWRV